MLRASYLVLEIKEFRCYGAKVAESERRGLTGKFSQSEKKTKQTCWVVFLTLNAQSILIASCWKYEAKIEESERRPGSHHESNPLIFGSRWHGFQHIYLCRLLGQMLLSVKTKLQWNWPSGFETMHVSWASGLKQSWCNKELHWHLASNYFLILSHA